MKPFLMNINERGKNCCNFATVLFYLQIPISTKVSIESLILNVF